MCLKLYKNSSIETQKLNKPNLHHFQNIPYNILYIILFLLQKNLQQKCSKFK